MKVNSLFIVDIDGTLWHGDVTLKAIYKMYEKDVFANVNLDYEDLENLLTRIYYSGGKYLRKIVYCVFSNIIKKHRNEKTGTQKLFRKIFLRGYLQAYEEVKRKIRLYNSAEKFLNNIKNYGAVVLWSDGLYEDTFGILRKMVLGYDRIVDEEIYPEKLELLGFSHPFKPNKKVVEMLIKKYEPEIVFSIGNHIYYDGFITENVNGKSIIIYYKSANFAELISNYWRCNMVRKNYHKILKLYVLGKIVVVRSFDEAISVIDKVVNDRRQYRSTISSVVH